MDRNDTINKTEKTDWIDKIDKMNGLFIPLSMFIG